MSYLSEEFKRDLSHLMNQYSVDNDLDTPDFIIAEYLVDMITDLSIFNRKREQWYDVHLRPGVHWERVPSTGPAAPNDA